MMMTKMMTMFTMMTTMRMLTMMTKVMIMILTMMTKVMMISRGRTKTTAIKKILMKVVVIRVTLTVE